MASVLILSRGDAGCRERVAAMTCKPKLLICDQAQSALGVSIQAQIKDLLIVAEHDPLDSCYTTDIFTYAAGSQYC